MVMAVRDKIKTGKNNQNDSTGTVIVRQKVRQKTQKQGKRKSFLRMRMWIHYLLSALQKDRGKIPDNIGDRIMITNNVYITKYYMSSVIHVTALGLDTPFTFTGELTRYLRSHGCDAVVDVSFKNTVYDVKLKDSGLLSRINAWERAAEEEDIPQREKEVAARCLYTVHIAKMGEPLFKTRIFITVRAKTGSKLSAAEKMVYKYLTSIGADFMQITATLQDTLKYMAVMSDYKDNSVKDIKAVVTSEETLVEMLPNSGSYNGSSGGYVGVDLLNNAVFNLDMSKVTKARNMYIYAPSGEGKTVLAVNMCASYVEDGYAVCVMDIKGNEFTNFIKATGGYIVSMRQNSSGYINSWRMHKEDCTYENAEAYFARRIALCKEQMMILSGITDEGLRSDLEELLDSFHDSFYTSIGVLPNNQNSWVNTENLTPFDIYDALVDYLTAEVIAKYEAVSRKVLNNLRMTMSRNGSKSYVFKEEFDYASILKANTLMFDFGILEGTTELDDMTLFRLKFTYMRRLNAEFAAYKYAKGVKVVKVLEESQIAVNDPDIMKGYVEEFTLRRAQGQTTILLGNSITALLSNPISRPLVENITGIFVGRLEDEDVRRTVIEKFGLSKYEELMQFITKESRFRNSFLFINRMEDSPSIPVVRVILDNNRAYKLFTPVAQDSSFMKQ